MGLKIIMHKIWDKLFEKGEFTSLEPDEEVLNFVALLKRNRAKRILDLGCGACRHIIYLALKGFEVYGSDFSLKALKICQERLKERKIEAYIKAEDVSLLGYRNECFDAVICLNTIYHNTLKGIKRTIAEIQRILRNRGLLLVNFMSKRTWKYGKGTKVEEGTYLQDEAWEKGILHHYSDEREIRELFYNFNSIELKLKERKIGEKVSSRWIVIAQK